MRDYNRAELVTHQQTLSDYGFASQLYTDGVLDYRKFLPLIDKHGSNMGEEWNTHATVYVGGRLYEQGVTIPEGARTLRGFCNSDYKPLTNYAEHMKLNYLDQMSGEWRNLGEAIMQWKVENDYQKPLKLGPLYPAGTGKGTIYSLTKGFNDGCFMILNGLISKSSGTRLTW